MTNSKDIELAAAEFNLSMLLPLVAGINYEQLVAALAGRVTTLLKNDFAALIQLLYTMDISEGKLRYYLHENTGEMAATIIAKLMIERQLQKIEVRRSFTKNNNIPDDEKW